MSRIVESARGWIGTPYVHQASTKGAGCDCLGLLRGVWREINGAEPESVPTYGPDWDEPQGDEVLWEAAKRHLNPTQAEWAPGQVLLFRMRAHSVAKHIGILSKAGPQPAFIHAYTGHGVVESALSVPWKRRVVARFELEGN